MIVYILMLYNTKSYNFIHYTQILYAMTRSFFLLTHMLVSAAAKDLCLGYKISASRDAKVTQFAPILRVDHRFRRGESGWCEVGWAFMVARGVGRGDFHGTTWSLSDNIWNSRLTGFLGTVIWLWPEAVIWSYTCPHVGSSTKPDL